MMRPHRLEQSSFVGYALPTVVLVLGLSSRPTCSQDICSRSTVRASIPLCRFFARYKFVTYLLNYEFSDDVRIPRRGKNYPINL